MSNDWNHPSHQQPPPHQQGPPQNLWDQAPAGDPYYDPDQKPSPVLWYQVYAGALSLVYIGLIGLGILMLFFATESSGAEATELFINGIVMVGMGIPFGLVTGASIFFPRTKWAHVSHIVILGLGMTSFCCLPICIPILLQYTKPEVKRYFGVEDPNNVAGKFS